MFALTLSLFLILSLATAVLGALLLQERAARHEIARRTDLVAKGIASRPLARFPVGLSPHLAAIGDRFLRLFAIGLPYRWGMHANPFVLMLLAAMGASLSWLMLRVLFHLSIFIVLPVTVAALLLLPRQVLKMQQDAAERRFLDLFPDAIDMVVRMVRAGLPVVAAIRAVGKETQKPVSDVFSSLADQVDIGILFDDALVQAGERVGLADFRFFVVSVSLQHATGGNIAATLEILSEIIRKRRAARLRANATTAEVRISAIILGSLPFVVIGGLLIMSPAYLTPLITDPRGNVIVGAAIVSMFLGFATMRQMMRHATQL